MLRNRRVGWGLVLITAGCAATKPAPEPAPAIVPEEVVDPNDAVAVRLARFELEWKALLQPVALATSAAVASGERGPVFDPSALIDGHFAFFAGAADAGDPRALGWCLVQLGQDSTAVEGALAEGRPKRWWAAFLASDADDATILRVVKALGRTHYLFEHAPDDLDRLLERADAPETKARVLGEQAELIDTTDAMRASAIRRRLVAEFADTTCGRRARADLLRAEVLQVGQPFPGWDTERYVDLTAARANRSESPAKLRDDPETSFRLSEYRGKVVALIFWDYSCGFCMAEIPFERELRARLAPRGFEIVGVYTDSDFEQIERASRSLPVPWRNAWDGPGELRDGPLGRRLGVHFAPFTVVLDRDGTIRAVGARGEALERAVEKALGSGQAPR